MTVAVASLERRSTAELRAFVRAQHVEVERHSDRVEQPEAAVYRRFLVRRAPLEGTCNYYESYNASGDENDWCILIAPDPSYSWMVDRDILASLSLFAGSPMDLDEVKVLCGSRVIECELTPDDGLYDKFLRRGLPIQSGGSEGQNKHQGPEGDRVGVYGVFCGDYGHGGRPEIHPFDAFWKQRHATERDPWINWDFGVFQDDSNRFNETWSDPPIDVEFRVPFCVDVPVTLRAPRTSRVRFALTRSDVCSVVGKDTRGANAPDLTETFTAKTVRLNRNRENRVEVTVEDATGLAGRPFGLSFEDVTYTTAGQLGFFSLQAWLAGFIVMRVAVDLDGFAYWNLRGPNSTTAADAEGDDDIVTDPGPVMSARAAEPPEPPEPEPIAVKVTAARPVVSTGEKPAIAAEVSVLVERSDGVASTDRLVTVRPRETPLILDDAIGRMVELESFDLFALAIASQEPVSNAPIRIQADVSDSIARLAGLESSRRTLGAQPATVEVDEFVSVDVVARYAPYRDGEVQGEEQSLLSESLNGVDTGPVRVRCEIQVTDATGQSRRIRTADVGARDGDGQPVARLEAGKGGQRLVVGPLGRVPTVLRVEGVVEDRFGLRSEISTATANFRVVHARPWVEHATGTAIGDLRQRLHQADQRARRAPTHEARASAGMLRCLVEVIEALDVERAVPAAQVAGAVRLAARVQQLLPAGTSARQSHQRR